MANTKISQLTDPGAAQGTDQFRMARPGVPNLDYKLTIDDVVAYTDSQLTPISITQIDAPNGVAPLDGASLVPIANLPFSAIAYKGTWNASTNSPTITSSVGTNGDFYWVTVAGSTNINGINSWSIGDVIVFKGGTNTWEKGTMGTGTPGPPGTNGSTVLSGPSNPLVGQGANGDFYINTSTKFIFGPKAGGVWPAGVSLVGPAGANGAPGTPGSPGTPGTNGNTILSGAVNPVNGQGNNGDFYLNTSSSTLFGPKVAGAWSLPGVSLIGPIGPTGPAGSGAAPANTAAFWGAAGNGTGQTVGTTVDPNTGLPYTLLNAQARWNRVRERFSVDTISVSATTSWPNGGTFTITNGLGTRTVTLPLSGTALPTTAAQFATQVATRLNQLTSSGYDEGYEAVGTDVICYTRSTTAVTASIGGGVGGAIGTPVRSKTFDAFAFTLADSVDYVALQQLFLLCETQVGYNTVELTPGAVYSLSRTLQFPTTIYPTANTFKAFQVNGNMATVRSLSTTGNDPGLILMERRPASNKMALVWQATLPKIVINDIFFRLPTQTVYNTDVKTQCVGVRLMGYQSQVNNCTFFGGDIGVDFQFNLQGTVYNCTFENQILYSISMRRGQWFDANADNSCGHAAGCKNIKIRLYEGVNSGDVGQFAGIFITDTSDCVVENVILEGVDANSSGALGDSPNWGIYFNSRLNVNVKDFAIYNLHLEKEMKYYAVFIRQTPDAKNEIKKVSLTPTNNFTRLVYAYTPNGTSITSLTDWPYQPPVGPIFKSVGGSCWRMTDVFTPAPQPSGNLAANFAGANDWLSTRTDIWDTTTDNWTEFGTLTGVKPTFARFDAVRRIA